MLNTKQETKRGINIKAISNKLKAVYCLGQKKTQNTPSQMKICKTSKNDRHQDPCKFGSRLYHFLVKQNEFDEIKSKLTYSRKKIKTNILYQN